MFIGKQKFCKDKTKRKDFKKIFNITKDEYKKKIFKFNKLNNKFNS